MQRRSHFFTLVPSDALNGGWGQSCPDRPARLVVPYAPGGRADMVALLIADEWGKALDQSMSIDHEAGAGLRLGRWRQHRPHVGRTLP